VKAKVGYKEINEDIYVFTINGYLAYLKVSSPVVYPSLILLTFEGWHVDHNIITPIEILKYIPYEEYIKGLLLQNAVALFLRRHHLYDQILSRQ